MFIIVSVLGLLTGGLIVYQRYLYHMYRAKQRASEESELMMLINRIEIDDQLKNVGHSFNPNPRSSVPVRKFNRTVRRKRTVSQRY